MIRLLNGAKCVMALAVLGLSGCGSDDEAAATVNVALDEYTVIPSPASIKAGSIKFVVTNSGQEVHELVVVKTDLALTQLPTKADGTFDEEGAGVTAIDEIEDIAVGASASLTVNLSAGHYVLVCNIAEPAGAMLESHFDEGMLAAFDVE